MDFEMLSKNIKQKCKEYEINVNQLEKELGFGTGSISRWKQSSPSIDKVKAVADYFGISVDEICGFHQVKEEMEFMKCLIRKTAEGEIVWIPCSDNDMLKVDLHEKQLKCNFTELYCLDYNQGTFFVGCNGETPPELFISLDDDICIKQNENPDQLKELWKLLKEKELQLKERIERYKMSFIHL